MNKLTITADFGGSGTKVCYQLADWRQPKYLILNPMVKVGTARLKSRENWQSDLGADIDSEWIEYQDSVVAFGSLGEHHRADPDQIFAPKYENAIWKLAAIAGRIATAEQVNLGKTKTTIAILLPYSEYCDREELIRFAREVLRGYRYKGKKMRVRIENIICRPEGGGLLTNRLLEKGVEYVRGRTIVILMLGHRNATLLKYVNGQAVDGDSPLIGFYEQVLQSICRAKSGITEKQVLKALLEGLKEQPIERRSYGIAEDKHLRSQYPTWSDLESVRTLATASNRQLRAREIERLGAAFDDALHRYWSTIAEWLEKKVPYHLKEVDECLVSGGSSYYCLPNLEEMFNCEPLDVELSDRYTSRGGAYTPLVWQNDLLQSIREDLNLGASPSETIKALRLAEGRGLHRYAITH